MRSGFATGDGTARPNRKSSGTFEAAVGIFAERAIAILLRGKRGRLDPQLACLAAFGAQRLLTPGRGGTGGDGADIFELGTDGAVAMVGLLGPA
jgi:hypothetical protein